MTDLSVLMPVYNASNYPPGWVERAVNSVLYYQPGIDVKLCIGDDGSNDGYLDRMVDERIRIVRAGDEPTGGSRAANAAANIATGRYFIILSCRSWYEPRSLAAMVKFLDSNERYGFCYGNTIKYMPNGYAAQKIAPPFNRNLFLNSFPSSFGYMYRREFWDEGARYGCDVYAEDEKRWVTIGDHYMLAQIVLKADGYAMKNLQVLHYQYGGVTQSNDILSKYKGRLMTRFRHLLEGAINV